MNFDGKATLALINLNTLTKNALLNAKFRFASLPNTGKKPPFFQNYLAFLQEPLFGKPSGKINCREHLLLDYHIWWKLAQRLAFSEFQARTFSPSTRLISIEIFPWRFSQEEPRWGCERWMRWIDGISNVNFEVYGINNNHLKENLSWFK